MALKTKTPKAAPAPEVIPQPPKLTAAEAQERNDLVLMLDGLTANKLLHFAEQKGIKSPQHRTWPLPVLREAKAFWFDSKPAATPAKTVAKTPTKQTEKPTVTPTTEPLSQFTISHNDSQVKVFLGDTAPAQDGWKNVTVTTAKELQALPMPILLALVNKGRQDPIKKFAGKEPAANMAYKNLPHAVEKTSPKGAAKGTAKKAAAKQVEEKPAVKPFNDFPAKTKDQIKQVKEGTKVALMVDLLAQEGGVTLTTLKEELSKTGKEVSARAWLGYDLKLTGYGVRTEETEDGTDLVAFLVLPKGMKAPLAHKAAEETKPVAKKAAPAKKAAAKKAVVEAAEDEEEEAEDEAEDEAEELVEEAEEAVEDEPEEEAEDEAEEEEEVVEVIKKAPAKKAAAKATKPAPVGKPKPGHRTK